MAQMRERHGEAPGSPLGQGSPPRRPAAAPAAPAGAAERRSPRNHERTRETQEGGKSYEPWLGKAAKLDKTSLLIISHFHHRIIEETTLQHGGAVVLTPKIKYRTKYEPAHKEREIKADTFNPTRLGDYLVASELTPDEVKEKVARQMRSSKAKAYVASLDAKKQAGNNPRIPHSSLSIYALRGLPPPPPPCATPQVIRCTSSCKVFARLPNRQAVLRRSATSEPT
eukprot:7391746-Prymnesium_polylepis.2